MTTRSTLLVSLQNLHQTEDELDFTSDNTMHIEMPSEFLAEHLQKSLRDAELVRELLSDQSEDVLRLLNLIIQGNINEARKLALALGLFEERYQAEGGGLKWLIVILLAIILL
jgi:hypothetical protein